jgi:hypothetical protein
MNDITKKCVDCQNDFIITAGEQEFYSDKGLNMPKRCENCRKKRKAERLNN